MANTKSSEKSARKTITRTARNNAARSVLKSGLKKTRSTLTQGTKEAAAEQISTYASVLDKMVKRGIIHRNVANRKKSRLARALAAKAS